MTRFLGCTVFAVLLTAAASLRVPPLDVHKGPSAARLYQGASKYASRCKEHYRNATLDHFSWVHPAGHKPTYRQRYFVCNEFWAGPDSPIFFYVGNEADVLLYLEHTGLIWESAEEFGALIVFAEHRYYGNSLPWPKEELFNHLQYLSSEQALADYSELVEELKAELKTPHSAVIGFGGSYGGMLTTWWRLKYPHIVDGGIAGSAPIWSFLGEEPAYDPGAFMKIVTRDATPAAGAAPPCAGNVREAWRVLFKAGETEEGRDMVRKAMRVCPASRLDTPADVAALVSWATDAFGSIAMGNYPYPSSYILNGVADMPAFPMRVACESLAKPDLEAEALLSGLAQAIGVFYNATGELGCYDFAAAPNPESQMVGRLWNYQWCTENLIPFSQDGVQDMFWPSPFVLEDAKRGCQQMYSVTPRPLWMTTEYGGRDLPTLSNLVFSNGGFDPWHPGGVLQNLSDSLVAVYVPEGAHHLDLMFSHEGDPDSVLRARATERAMMHRWVDEKAAKLRQQATESLQLAQQ